MAAATQEGGMRDLEIMIWIGSGLTVMGLIGIVWCIMAARAAKQDMDDEAALRARMQRIVAVNMGALVVSALGLMLVVIGVFFAR